MNAYERLREEAILHHSADGELAMTLFLREGMARWLEVGKTAFSSLRNHDTGTYHPDLLPLPPAELRAGIIQSLARITSSYLSEVSR